MALRKFIVERDIPEVVAFERELLRETAAQLDESLRELGPDIQWLKDYTTPEKTFSVYLAPDENNIRERSKTSGFPAVRIIEVYTDQLLGTISVVRGIKDDGTFVEPSIVLSTTEGSVQLHGGGPVDNNELLSKEGDQLVLIQGREIDESFAVDSARTLATLSRHIRPAVGTQAWVVLLCRFLDSPGPPPESQSWFEDLVSASRPGLRHFFNDISYGTLDTTIDVMDWRTLPGTRADYPSDEGDLLPACTDLYPEVDFTLYYGVIMVVDQDLNNASGLGTGREAVIHGNRQFWGLVWLGTSGWRHQWIWAQEMGHTFGLKHTLAKSTPILRSGWDFMGTLGNCTDMFQGGCLPQHTTAYNKDRLGWLDTTRSTTVSSGVHELRMASLSNPSEDGLLYAELHIPGAPERDRYYAIEARHRSGYDNNIPATNTALAIVIHEIDQSRNPESYTLDKGTGSPNGSDGAWVESESFLGDGVHIEVLRASGTAMDVRIAFAPRPPNVSLEYAGCFFGSVRFVPTWSAHPGDLATSFQAEVRYASSSNWVPLSGSNVISANSNQRVYLRVKACNAVGCSDYSSISAKQECIENPL